MLKFGHLRLDQLVRPLDCRKLLLADLIVALLSYHLVLDHFRHAFFRFDLVCQVSDLFFKLGNLLVIFLVLFEVYLSVDCDSTQDLFLLTLGSEHCLESIFSLKS